MELWIAAAKLLFVAQATQATVAGVVRDGQSGEPLRGAVIALTDIDRAVVSDSNGRYILLAVPPGPQHVTVRRIGYAPRALHALVPSQGQLEINVALQSAPIRLRAVEVRPNVVVRGLDGEVSSVFPDRTLSAAAVRNHPLLAEPDAFLALSGGEIVVRAESPSGMHVHGGAADQTAYVLDGIPVFNPYHAAGTFSAWNPDALERVQLASSSPSAAFPDALSGVVSGVTRTPGSTFRAQGSVTTTQMRVTADGPLGVGGAGYLLSARSGFPGVVVPRRESSYLRGGTDDLLATVHAPVFGGRLRLLGYESGNELSAAATASAEDGVRAGSRRNVFAWRSRSTGAEWLRRSGHSNVRLIGWSAAATADALWDADGGAPASMAATLREDGLLGAVQRRTATTTTEIGLRIRQSRTSYTVGPENGGSPLLALEARTPLATLFVAHDRPLASGVTTNVGLSAVSASGRIYLNPQARVRWSVSPHVDLSGAYARSHQFVQSLRNAESVVGTTFPVDLYVGAGDSGIPVARGNRVVLAADLHLTEGTRLGTQAYLRDFHGLLLVAPRTGEPFAVAGEPAVGSGKASGFSVDAAASGARYGVVASYGWQQVRFSSGSSSYVPEHGSAHVLDAGVILFPTATSSIRVGATGSAGRRATGATSAIEWEACNLLDQGCEFGGSPRSEVGRLGAAKLPPYLRIDLGFRKHWHLGLAGKDALVALFGTVTNVLGRTNVLTTALDPTTGERVEIGMRPLAPLVVGLDWRF